MTVADDIQYVREELDQLYREQRSSEHAPYEGRVTCWPERREMIDRRAERIRVLERRLAGLEREHDEQEDDE